MPTLEQIVDEVADGSVRAAEPVTMPWRMPVLAFVVGFLATVLPAAVGTRLLASQLPFATAVLRGWSGLLFASLVAAGAGLACAVIVAAREIHR